MAKYSTFGREQKSRSSFVSLVLMSFVFLLTWLVPVVAAEDSPPVVSREACPEDMSDMEGFCIDRIPVRSRVNWYVSSEACEAQGKRLCTNDEWLD